LTILAASWLRAQDTYDFYKPDSYDLTDAFGDYTTSGTPYRSDPMTNEEDGTQTWVGRWGYTPGSYDPDSSNYSYNAAGSLGVGSGNTVYLQYYHVTDSDSGLFVNYTWSLTDNFTTTWDLGSTYLE